jgi:hypothetical protein
MSGFEEKSLCGRGQDQSRNGKNRNRPPSSLGVIPVLVVLFGFRNKNHFPLDCGIAGE